MLNSAKPACARDHAHAHIADRPVDLVHLAHHAMGDRDLESEILGLFQRQSVIYLERLRQARDAKSLHAAAHTLKGSARGIGAWAVADAAAAVEGLGGRIAARTTSDEVEMLADAIEEANAFIAAVLMRA